MVRAIKSALGGRRTGRRRVGRRTTLGALTLTLLCGAAAAQNLEPSRIDVSELGPQVGEIVPQFSLPDQAGDMWTRESIMGPSGAMLVFIRSADW